MDFQYLYDHSKLNAVLRDLVQAFVSGQEPDEGTMKGYATAAWAASSLADSMEALHKKKAFLFASLSKKIFPNDTRIDVLCFAIFSRTGNVPSTRHLSALLQNGESKSQIMGALEIEFIESYAKSISRFSDKLTLTDFQTRVESALVDDSAGLFTAPTSAGKSFIVHEYVKYRLDREGSFLGVFIVPTKALISQFSSIYRAHRLDADIACEVFTSVPDGLEIESEKAIFCLTQERCIKLLSSEYKDRLSFVFVDEIQKVEDKGRGALLEYVINELQRSSPKAQMFFAGPYISNAVELAKSLCLDVEIPIETENSPVSQMVLLVKPVRKERKLNLTLLAGDEADGAVSFDYEVDKKYLSRWRNQTTAIGDAIRIFASDAPSIAYASGPGTARNWAVEYAANNEVGEEGVNRNLKELVEYVKDSIHPQCSLVYCLENRIAFHHGKLPDFVREEIEELFSERELDVLFCTSTLLEGVNLPADKIFVIKPSKGDENLSLVEFRNLIGRAGRLKDHLNGIVYCIQPPKEEEDDWVNEYKDFKTSPVEPYLDTSLKKHGDEIQAALREDRIILKKDDTNNLRSTLTILRSRFIVDKDATEQFLVRKTTSDDHRQEIVSSLKASMAKLIIPAELIEKSPYVDPILQNKLYIDVVASPQRWKIRRHEGFSADFAQIFKKLDGIFDIVKESRPYSNLDFQDNIIIGYAKDWLSGMPFSRIVKRRSIPREFRKEADVAPKIIDQAVQWAMDYVTSDVGFVTAKYFSVLSEVLKYILGEDDLEEFSLTISLPVMLELGSRDPKVISLISASIPRGAALVFAKMIPDVDDPVSWLTQNQGKADLQKLPRIYRKILKRTGIWK